MTLSISNHDFISRITGHVFSVGGEADRPRQSGAAINLKDMTGQAVAVCGHLCVELNFQDGDYKSGSVSRIDLGGLSNRSYWVSGLAL
ncbi:hypothetical protein ACOMHN_009688 [Nucella lapillus]